MKAKLFVCIFIILCWWNNIDAQIALKSNLFSINNEVSPLVSGLVRKSVDDAVMIKIDRAVLENIYSSKENKIRIQIPESNNQNVIADLTRIDVLTQDAKIIAKSLDADAEVGIENPVVSYTGNIEGQDKTFIVINISKDRISGMINYENDNIVLGQVNESKGINLDNYVLYRESKLKVKNGFICGTEDNMSQSAIEEMRSKITSEMNDNLTNDIRVAKIAIDVDFTTYLAYQSSVTNATNYALSVMSAVAGLFMKEENVKLVVPYIRIWTTQDPYTGATSNPVLQNFKNTWNATQQSVERTVAHLISVRSGGLGGIAFLNTLCASVTSGSGYGFSNTNGPVSVLPAYIWDVQVVTHELGHNFGSNHTHSCSWVGGAIDSCYAVEGGCYTGPAIPRLGTIMSYCHLTSGGISFILGFGPQPRAIIRSRSESAPCMTNWGSAIAVAYPNGGEILRSGVNLQIYWGTSLTGNVDIEFTSNNGASWQTIQSNVSAQQRLIDWTVPYLNSTESKIRVKNSSNPNESDSSDNVFKIIPQLNLFNLVSPPSLTRINVSANDTSTVKFVWAGAGTDPSLRYKFKIRKLGTPTDYFFESNNNGTDTTINLRKSMLDTLAQIFGTIADSVRCTWKAGAYNGTDSTASGNTFIITLARTNVGINFISSIVPEKFNLGNNYPNPFNPSTTIKFDIAKSGLAELTIYDLAGRVVSKLINERLEPGSYEYTFDASNLPSGTYFYRLTTTEYSATKRMVLLK